MNSTQTTPVSTTAAKRVNVAIEKVVCPSVDAYYDMVQENGEMDELRNRIECITSFRDSYNDQD